jgi:hypothetical protein
MVIARSTSAYKNLSVVGYSERAWQSLAHNLAGSQVEYQRAAYANSSIVNAEEISQRLARGLHGG